MAGGSKAAADFKNHYRRTLEEEAETAGESSVVRRNKRPRFSLPQSLAALSKDVAAGFPADSDNDTSLDLETPDTIKWFDLNASRWYRVISRRVFTNQFGDTTLLILATLDGEYCLTYASTTIHDRLVLLYTTKEFHQKVYLRPIPREGSGAHACRIRCR